MSNDLLKDVAARATRYLDDVTQREVFPSPAALRDLQGFSVELQDESIDPATVLTELDTLGAPATVACTGGRYFGFVTGGSLPVAVAADWLVSAWDQNAALHVMSPAMAQLAHPRLWHYHSRQIAELQEPGQRYGIVAVGLLLRFAMTANW